MKSIKILLLLMLCAANVSAQEVSSPDGHYRFLFHATEGRLSYDITYRDKPVIAGGELGIDIDNRLSERALGMENDSCLSWGDDLRLDSYETQESDTLWHAPYGERTAIRDQYRQLTLHLAKGKLPTDAAPDGYEKRHFYLMDIEVRAYDEGIALRYRFPEQTNGLFLNITGERTSFPMAEGCKAWFEDWAQGPFELASLAEKYDAIKANPLQNNDFERPLLLKTPNGLYIALQEAGMRDFARGKFCLTDSHTLRVKLFGGAQVISPYATPWRVVMVGEKAVDLINHKDIVLNLNHRQADLDFSFIKTGKAYRCGQLNRQYIMRGIDFAEQMGMQFIELDARWYGPEMYIGSSALMTSPDRDFTIPEVCDSARRHGLGVWVYVNQRALHQQLDSILPLYRKWGVSGIKFGFVQVGSQMWSNWLHEAVRRCAEYGLMVDIHDEYRPTGVSRTLPNLLTQEGIRGQEEMPDARHNTVLPFTRTLCGPADYTPSYYNKRIQTTHTHQLALPLVYYSPLTFLFWYDDPKLYDVGQELDFWRRLPTTWDESIALEGEPGQYIAQARRLGNEWYVGIVNGLDARSILLNTTFLTQGKYQVTMYFDDPSLPTRSKVGTKVITLKAGTPLPLSLLPSGGLAMRIEPIRGKKQR